MSPNEPVDPLDKSIKALTAAANSIYIRKLRFPHYRNLEKNTELTFTFPITVLLGRNGTNKSAILHALYGSPIGKTIADFWFETELDAIPSTRNGLKPSVVHSYVPTGMNDAIECIKARAPRSIKDPDYWEPVKPTRRYGFPRNATRQPPVSLNVVHLDFRGELPAFDKYFYFPDPRHLAERAKYAKKKGTLRREYRKQDYLRLRTRLLKKELENKGVPLTETELKVLRYILERDYVGGQVVRHSLFHAHEGWTLVFRTKEIGGGYSDAFAGSGESAAALLVHNILEAEDKSLILLDEPETSLHPRAQQRMLQFLAHQAVRKRLQIVMATHSIYLAQNLPQSAIRVLMLNTSARVEVDATLSATEALHEISTIPSGKVILVEDERAQDIVLASLRAASRHAADEFKVLARPGGTSRIFRDIQAHANSQRKDVLVVLDGDHEPAQPIPPEGSLPQGEKELRKLIENFTKGPNENGLKLDFVDAAEMIKYLEFLRRSVLYLPGITPERLVWSDERAAQCISNGTLPDHIASESDYKKKISLLAAAIPGFNESTAFHVLLAAFLTNDSENRRQLTQMVHDIRSRI